MQTSHILPSLAILTLFASCSKEPAATTKAPDGAQQPVTTTTPATQPATQQPAAQPAASDGNAKVLETMDSGGYTYMHLEAGGKQDWYAVPQFAVKVGDLVSVPAGAMAMQNFESQTLDRTFDVIYFAQGVQKVSASDATPDATPDAAPTTAKEAALVQQVHADARKVPTPEVALEGTKKADGGMTVAEIWAQGAAGAGKEVKLRGKVVKVNTGILGKNWLHVRDGSGTEGTNDITITTDGLAKVGDTVLVTGQIAADRDFGAGYVYALLIEDAKITIE